MQTGQYSTSQFAMDVDTCVRKYPNESEVLRQIEPLLEKLIKSPGSVPSEAFTPRKDRFAMTLIHAEGRDVLDNRRSLASRPDNSNPRPLDMGTYWVYDGEEREALFRRTDDGSNSKIAKIEKVSKKINTKGHVTVLGHRGIPRVDNISGKPTTSTHVYGRDIGHAERHSYDPVTGEIGRFVSGYCNVLRDIERF